MLADCQNENNWGKFFHNLQMTTEDSPWYLLGASSTINMKQQRCNFRLVTTSDGMRASPAQATAPNSLMPVTRHQIVLAPHWQQKWNHECGNKIEWYIHVAVVSRALHKGNLRLPYWQPAEMSLFVFPDQAPWPPALAMRVKAFFERPSETRFLVWKQTFTFSIEILRIQFPHTGTQPS